MVIHNIFIFKKSGICIFGKNFTNTYKMEDNLISAFFTAISSFTQEVIGEKVKTVEMDQVKFTIIKKDTYYYGILCDKSENFFFLNDLIKQIHKEHLKQVKKCKIKKNIEYIRDLEFDRKIEQIIDGIFVNKYDINNRRSHN